MARRSPPELKAVPAPVRMATRAVRSWFRRSSAATMPSTVSRSEMGLRRAGSFRVMVTIWPSCWYSTLSVIACVLELAKAEPAGDDAAEDLAGAATQGEGRGVHHGVREDRGKGLG